jgi:hypothetical protein
MPQSARRSMAEDSARAAGEDGGHQPAPPREERVTDGIHASMHAVKAPGLHPIGDRLARESENGELPRGNDPVLAGGESRDPPIDESWADFDRSVRTYSAHPSSIARHAPSMAGHASHVGRALHQLRYAAVASMLRRT